MPTNDRLESFGIYQLSRQLFAEFWDDSEILGRDYRGRELVKQQVRSLDSICSPLTTQRKSSSTMPSPRWWMRCCNCKRNTPRPSAKSKIGVTCSSGGFTKRTRRLTNWCTICTG